MPRTKLNKSFSHKLLKAVAIGGLVVLAASNPYAGIKLIEGMSRRKRWRDFYSSLYALKRRRLIQVRQTSDRTYRVSVTHAGRRIVAKYDIDMLRIKPMQKWDGIWRVCLFDIPASKSHARFALLAKLKELGFIMMQRSVWTHPFPCQMELEAIAHAYEVKQYVRFHEAYDVSHEEMLKHDFEKQNGIALKA